METDLLWPIGLTLLLGYGAYSDVVTRRLPNWLALALLVTGIAHAYISTGNFTDTGMHAAHAGIALVAGLPLFATGILGGGDVKFYTGLASWFPLTMGPDLLIRVALLGGIFTLLWLVIRRVQPRNSDQKNTVFTKFPYGIAIAAGGMVMAWTAALPG